jgi:hypothetical protein
MVVVVPASTRDFPDKSQVQQPSQEFGRELANEAWPPMPRTPWRGAGAIGQLGFLRTCLA